MEIWYQAYKKQGEYKLVYYIGTNLEKLEKIAMKENLFIEEINDRQKSLGIATFHKESIII